MPGLAVLAVAEHAGEHREWGGQGVPEPAVVRIRAGVEQQLGRLQRGRPPDVRVVAGVCLVEQRRPAMWPTRLGRSGWSRSKVPAHRRRIRARGRDEQVMSGKFGMLGEKLSGRGAISGLVVTVGQASQSEKPIGQRLVCRSGLAGGPGTVGHDLDVTA